MMNIEYAPFEEVAPGFPQSGCYFYFVKKVKCIDKLIYLLKNKIIERILCQFGVYDIVEKENSKWENILGQTDFAVKQTRI